MPSQADCGERLRDSRLHVGRRPRPVLEAERDVVLGPFHDELCGRVLEHEADARTDLDRSEGADVLAVELERPGHDGRDLVGHESGRGQGERALARAGRADDEHDRTGFQLEVDPLECRSVAHRRT